MTDNINKILGERGKTNGDFKDMCKIIQILRLNMRHEPGWEKLKYHQAEALDMIVHKIGRILAGDPDFKDHWYDISGYATLVADRCEQEPDKKRLTAEQIKRLDELRKQARAELSISNDPYARIVPKPETRFCVLCDYTTSQVRVNAAGYCLCEELGCPNVGKKVT